MTSCTKQLHVHDGYIQGKKIQIEHCTMGETQCNRMLSDYNHLSPPSNTALCTLVNQTTSCIKALVSSVFLVEYLWCLVFSRKTSS